MIQPIRVFLTLLVVLPSCLSSGSVSAARVRNGSFETGDFSDWMVAELQQPYEPLAVLRRGTTTAFSGFLGSNVVLPTDGFFAASNGFDGAGPGTFRLAQDIGIIASGDILTFDYRAGWDLLNFSSPDGLDRMFEVFIESPVGGTPPLRQLVLTAESGTSTAGGPNSDTGPLSARFDLTPLAGTDARLAFVWTVPENFTGPANAQLDNVRVIPEPRSVLLLVTLFVGLAARWGLLWIVPPLQKLIA